MVISEVSLMTAGIVVLSDDNFGLMMEIKVNVSNKVAIVAMTNMKTHMIMHVGKSSSKKSLAFTMKWFRRDGEFTPQFQKTRLNVRHNRESESHTLTHF